MAHHLRRQIREAAAALLTGLATTGGHVYASRVHPLSDGELPALRIYATEETSEPEGINPPDLPKYFERRLTLVIEACAKAGADLDDTLDLIAQEVEVALGAAPTLSGAAHDSWLSGTEIEFSGEGELPLGVARLSFTVLYITAATTPDILE
ncbi:MAG TPA: hypothetical protein VF104_07425 [Burkholderiales bacterium]